MSRSGSLAEMEPDRLSAQSAQVIQLGDTRVCKACGVAKVIDDFHFHRSTRGVKRYRSVSDTCQSCWLDGRKAEYRAAHPKAVKPPAPTQITCRVCQVTKPVSEFHKNPKMASGYKSQCRDCANAYCRDLSAKGHPGYTRSGIKNRPDKLKKRYGTTYAEIQRVLAAQHGLCANVACGASISLEVNGAKKGRAMIDHDHNRAHPHFRGLLCGRCNTTLGILETQESVILGLMEYLARQKEI